MYRRTRGNAFFTEEVLRSLVEKGAVRTGPMGWEVVDPDAIAIPDSMRLAVEDRIARLGEDARDVLVQAAVLGQEFSFLVLLKLTNRSEDDLLDLVERAQAARVLTDRSTAGEERYAFWDDQMQEVRYSGIPTARRRRYHLRAGGAIEAVYDDRLDDYLDELARHFGQANEAEKSADYAMRAADRNSGLYQWTRAQRFYLQASEALRQVPDSEATRRRRVDVLLKLIGVAFTIDEPAVNLARAREAHELAQSLTGADATSEDLERLTQVLFWLGRTHYYTCNYRAAEERYEQALRTAQAAGSELWSAIISAYAGMNLHFAGYPSRADQVLAPALTPLERSGRTYDWVLCAQIRAMTQGAIGDYANGLAELRRVFVVADSASDRRCLLIANFARFWLSLSGGDAEGMLQASRAGLALAEEINAPFFKYVSLAQRAWAESRAGLNDAAAKTMQEYRSWVERTGGATTHWEDYFAVAAAEIALNAGRLEEAAAAREAVAFAERIGGRLAEGLGRRVLASALLQQGEAGRAQTEEQIRKSLMVFEEGGSRLEAARTHVVWGEFLRDRGDTAAAREHLEKAAAQFKASGLTEELERTHRLLAGLAN